VRALIPEKPMPQMSSPTLELARVRAEIRRLKLREAVLRADVMDEVRERRADASAVDMRMAHDPGHSAEEQGDEPATGGAAGHPRVSISVLTVGAFAPVPLDGVDMPSLAPHLPQRRGAG
jgi:hypothetical protein